MSPQQAEVVHEGGEDALHGAKHGAEAQVEQHEEEQRGPEGAGGEQSHGLGEGYECQPCPLHTLGDVGEAKEEEKEEVEEQEDKGVQCVAGVNISGHGMS